MLKIKKGKRNKDPINSTLEINHKTMPTPVHFENDAFIY